MFQAYDFNPKMDSFVLVEESGRRLEEMLPVLTKFDLSGGVTYAREVRPIIDMVVTLFYGDDLEKCVRRSFTQNHFIVECAYGLYKIYF